MRFGRHRLRIQVYMGASWMTLAAGSVGHAMISHCSTGIYRVQHRRFWFWYRDEVVYEITRERIQILKGPPGCKVQPTLTKHQRTWRAISSVEMDGYDARMN